MVGVVDPTCGRQARLDSVLKWAWPTCGGCAWSYLWNAGKANSVLKWAWPACGGCGWSYLCKAGKAGLCSEVGVASLRQRTF